jgi:hypothetical protein
VYEIAYVFSIQQSSFQPGSNRAEVSQVAETEKVLRFGQGGWRQCRSRFAGISADAEMSASGAAGGVELFHSGLEPRPSHAEAGRAPEGPNHPLDFPQRPQESKGYCSTCSRWWGRSSNSSMPVTVNQQYSSCR